MAKATAKKKTSVKRKTTQKKSAAKKKVATRSRTTSKRKTVKKTTAKKTVAKKATAKKAVKKTRSKTTAKKATAKKKAVKKTTSKTHKKPAKKVAIKKKAVKKVTTKKTTAKKAKTSAKSKPVQKTKNIAPKVKKTKPQKIAASLSNKATHVSKKKNAKTTTKAIEKMSSTPHTKKITQAITTINRSPVRTERITTGIEKDIMDNILKTLDVDKDAAISTSVMGLPPYEPTSDEEYMNEAQREHFCNILERWKHQLMEAVDQTVSHMKDEAANFPDPNDRATQEEEFTLELRTRDRERKLIKKIDEALERLKRDDYGFCDACGIEIGIRRLEARPTATLCIDCKTVYEIREKQIG